MGISAVGYYTKDSYLIQWKYHQGFEIYAFCRHYCFWWFWMKYYVELWMERKEE
jgi:hypothetical protein